MSNRDILKKGLENLGIAVDDKMLNDFNIYREILVDWNQKMNLTGIEDEKEVFIKHFLDSVSAVTNDYIKDGLSIIDVGTGAGFPGLPLRICLRNTKVTLLDSLNKRINFLNEVIGKLELDNITAIHGRVEEVARNKEYRECFDVAVSRAVAPLNVLLEYMIPLVKVGGKCICMKGSNAEEEIETSKNALKKLNAEIETVESFELPGTDMKRNIVIVKKIAKTDKVFPRKAGTPSKKPL